jgi:hypothetical protein
VDRSAAFDGSWNLGNDKGAHLCLRMAAAVFDEGASGLLGSHQAGIGDEVSMDGVGVVEVNDALGEVSAVIEEDIEVGDVAAVVEVGDELVILLGSGCNFEAPDAAVVGSADEFDPFAAGHFMAGIVGDKSLEMLAAPGVAQTGFEFGVGGGGDLRRIVDRIQVGDEWNGKPIVSVDAVVAAQHHTDFVFAARAQERGCVGTDAI